MTEKRKQNWKTITLLLTATIIATLIQPALAQQSGGGPIPTPTITKSFTLSWNLTDARLEPGITPTYNPGPGIVTNTYSNVIDGMVPWYFTAGKTFTIYVANASRIINSFDNSLINLPISISATATANSTGGIKWTLTLNLPSTIPAKNITANWTIAIVLNNYPSPGMNWLVFNVTTNAMNLTALMNNLTTVSLSSFLAVSPTKQPYIQQSLSGGKLYLFRPVRGATPPSSLYFILPYLYFFNLFAGTSTATNGIGLGDLFASNLKAIIKLAGTPVTYPINNTLTSRSTAIYTTPPNHFVGFGPIYYVNIMFNGISQGRVSVTQQPVEIIINEVLPSAAEITLFDGTANAYALNSFPTHNPGAAAMLDWYVSTQNNAMTVVGLSALNNETGLPGGIGDLPSIVVGLPVIQIMLGSILDLKANLIINSSRVPNPIAAQKLYAKWFIGNSVLDENYVLHYETTPVLLPAGTMNGTVTPPVTSPPFSVSTVSLPPLKLYIYYTDIPVYAQLINTTRLSGSGPFTLNNITVGLMPVFINITQYQSGVPVNNQLQLDPNIANLLSGAYAFSSSINNLPTTPPPYSPQGVLYYVEGMYSRLYPTGTPVLRSATILQFPPYVKGVFNGTLVTPMYNYFPTPPTNGSYVILVGSGLYPVYTPLTQSYYYAFWLTYNNLIVGYGVFQMGYTNSSTPIRNTISSTVSPPTTGGGYLVPLFSAFNPASNATLTQFYNNGSEYYISGFSPALVETAYIAATYAVYNMQFLNLCNETITSGTVFISELTPGGGVVQLTPIPLSAVATVYKIAAPIGLVTSASTSGVDIETMVPLFNFTLNYFGYQLPSVNYTTRLPKYNYMLRSGTVNVIYFPLIDINVKVQSSTTPPYPLVGFVVSVISAVNGAEMWRAISNSSGLVLVQNVPINASYITPKSYVILKVRTIVPSMDKNYPYAPASSLYGQTYAEYAQFLGFEPSDDVYTFGTRGPFDQGLVVYNAQFSVPVNTICFTVFPVSVAVVNLHVVVTDLANNVLASQPIYPCATPSFCPSVYYNVTLTIVDRYSPYNYSSKWFNFTKGLYTNITDFRSVGITWMQPIFAALRDKYYSLLQRTLSDFQSGGLSLADYAQDYVGNLSYYRLAKLLALYSTPYPYATFTFPSIYNDFLVRLFASGQSFQAKVYYLGQMVFNQIIPVPSPNQVAIVNPDGTVQFTNSSVTVYIGGRAVTVPPNGTVIVRTTVYPVTYRIVSKNGTYTIPNTYLGVTFTDVLYRQYIYERSLLASSSTASYLDNVLSPFSSFSSAYVTALPIVINPGDLAIVESFDGTPRSLLPPTIRSVVANYSFAGYVLPNLMGFFVNSTRPTTMEVPLYMTSIYPNAFSASPGFVVFNLTMGIPAFGTVDSHLAEAVPIDSFTFNPATYTEYQFLVNETYLNASSVSVRGASLGSVVVSSLAGVRAIVVTQSAFGTVNLTYAISPNLATYRLFEAMVNATGMSVVNNATVTVYVVVSNSSGTFTVKAYSVDVRGVFLAAMSRTVPLYVVINYGAISRLVNPAQVVNVIVRLDVNGSGTYWLLPPAPPVEHVHVSSPVLSSGFGGNVTFASSRLYTDSSGVAHSVNYTVVEPNLEWFPYFGSPITVVGKANASGVVTLELPWWTVTTGAFGSRIARIWVMATPDVENIGVGSIVDVTPASARPYTGLGPGEVLPVYVVNSYVLLNYITPVNGATSVNVGEFGSVTSSGNLFMTAVGAGTGGTSAPMYLYDTLYPENLWNLTIVNIVRYVVRTTALESVEVYSNASFPVFVSNFTYSSGGKNFAVPSATVEVRPRSVVDIPVRFIYGSSYQLVSIWCDIGNFTPYIPDLSATFYYVPPNKTFVLPNGTALPFVVLPNGTVVIDGSRYQISSLEAPLSTPAINFTTLYAGSELTRVNTTVSIPVLDGYDSGVIVGAQSFAYGHAPYPINSTPGVVVWDIAGYTGPLPSASNDVEAKLVLTVPTLPLRVIEDWDGRPLPNQTVVVYSPAGASKPVAISFSGSGGALVQSLPVGDRVVVYWYDSYLLYVLTSGAYPYINIYDTGIATDVQTLGDALSSGTVETHVVPASLYFVGAGGTGIPGLLAVVYDTPTNGAEFAFTGVSGTDGSVTPVDPRIYPPSTSQLPPTNYFVYGFYLFNGTPLNPAIVRPGATIPGLVPVLANSFSIERTVTATELINSFTLSNLLRSFNIILVASSFGPIAGATLSYTVSEPECTLSINSLGFATIGGVFPPVPTPASCPTTPVKSATATTDSQGSVQTPPFVLPAQPFAVLVQVVANSWKGISLGYSRTFTITATNATTPLTLVVPAVELSITPVSASGQVLGELATTNVTCAGVPVASGTGTLDVQVPIPAAGSITCNITSYSYGTTASRSVVLTAAQNGQRIPLTVTLPLSGYYVPGIGFVPLSTFILLAIIALIIIILVVIALIEYNNYRRRRLAGLLGPPGGGR